MKVEIDITEEEMVALGYALAAGAETAKARSDDGMRAALMSLADKVFDSNERAARAGEEKYRS